MLAYIWPIALVILANTVYQVCAKEAPAGMHPMASLIVTYLTGAAASTVLYFVMNRGQADLLKELRQVNWAPFALGMVIVGLEVGFIYAYRAGWQVSTASIVQSAFVAVALIFVGLLLYGEALSWNKLLGVAVCLVGLVIINLK